MRGSHAVSFMTELEEVSMGIVVALDVQSKADHLQGARPRFG
jgi:hypothetical protein